MRTKLSPPSPPPAKDIRLTIPVAPDVHEAFSRIAKAGNMPVGRAMGQWLADTVEAANFMAEAMEKARHAPRMVANELHAYALGLADETNALLKMVGAKGREVALSGGTRSAGGPDRATTGGIPPSCNTGGKVPKKGPPKSPRGSK